MGAIYATGAEFQNHPTGLDTGGLVPNGTDAQNTSELALIMQMASSYADQLTYQPLYAHSRTETTSVRPDPYGSLTVRVTDFPLLSVTSAQWRQFATQSFQSINLQQIDILGSLADGHKYVAQDYPYATLANWGQRPLTVQTTYVAGYANALLTADAAAAATTLSLDDVTGILVGDSLTIYDGVSQETVAVSAVTPSTTPTTIAGVSQYPGTVTVSATAFAHNTGVRASEMPLGITTATIYIAAWMIKERRSGGGFSMEGTVQGLDTRVSEDMQMARLLLRPFVRVI